VGARRTGEDDQNSGTTSGETLQTLGGWLANKKLTS
jgi:hypothetical protein